MISQRLRNIPAVTKNLLIINFLIWALEIVLPARYCDILLSHLGLHYVLAPDFNPVQIITYMFLHDPHSPLHILFNMFTLWMFGCLLERIWGSKRYFVFYIVCGMGAALVQEGIWALTLEHQYIAGIAKLNGMTYESMSQIVDQARAAGDMRFMDAMAQFVAQFCTIGASGAIFGLLLGFAFVFPDMPMYIMFIPIPVKAKYMVVGYGVLEFFLGIAPGSGDTVAHFAHLGGMLFGLAILLWWKHKGTLRGGNFYS